MCKIIDITIKLWYINNRVNSGGDIVRFRRMILVLTIAFSAIFVSMIGTSYAYYVATAGTTINITTPNIDTGASVVFEQSQYININTAIPVASSSEAEKISFTITPNEEILSGKDVSIRIGIDDLYIDKELRVEDFKYSLYCWLIESDIDIMLEELGGTGLKFTTGIINNKYLKLGDFSPDSAIGCDISIWLQETGENQNHLMNKKFRGVVRVDTVFK